MNDNDVLKELASFYVELKEYQAYRIVSSDRELNTDEYSNMMGLREKLVHKSGIYQSLISELTNHEGKITLGIAGNERSYDIWLTGLKFIWDYYSVYALDSCIDITNRAQGKLESDIEMGIRDAQGKVIAKRGNHKGITSPKAFIAHGDESPINLYNRMNFHPKVISVSKSLFETSHYAQAIFETFKAVNNFVKEKTGLTLDGKDLMAKAFNENNPIIKINELLTQSDRDEQEGFRFLFMEAMVGIRNPKAHDNVVQTDPSRTLEYLSFASLLMRRVEEGKVNKHAK